MCIVSCARSSSSTYSNLDSAVPARVVTTSRSTSAYEKHSREGSPRQSTLPMSEEPKTSRTPVAIHATTAQTYPRITRKNSFTISGGPARVSYVSSRGAGYVRTSEKFFYGRDSGDLLLVNAEGMDNDFGREWEKGEVVKVVEGRGRRV